MRNPLTPEALAGGTGPLVTRCVGMEAGGADVGDTCGGVETASNTPCPCGLERATPSNVTRQLHVCGSEAGGNTLNAIQPYALFCLSKTVNL